MVAEVDDRGLPGVVGAALNLQLVDAVLMVALYVMLWSAPMVYAVSCLPP